MKLAFINATIYPVTSSSFTGTILVENGKIQQMGENLDPSGYKIVDCTDKHITPGFVDPHTHTGIWGEGSGSWPNDNDGNELTEAITPYVRVLDSIHPEDIGFEDARKGGVTTMGITHGSGNPIGGQVAVVKSYGTIVDEMVVKAPAGVKMALGENPKRVGRERKRAPNTRMGTAYLIRKTFYEVMEYSNEWNRYNEVVEGEKKPLPPKYDLGKETLVQVLNKEIPIRCHAHRADDIITAIRLAEEFGYELILDHTTEGAKVADTIVNKGIKVNVGPMLGSRSKRELNDATFETPGIIHNKGGFVSLMTDSPFNPIHSLRDNLIWAIREGLPESESLKLITINPAIVLGVDDRVGSLEVGKDADLLIFNGDPLDGRKRVITTYIDGVCVYNSN